MRPAHEIAVFVVVVVDFFSLYFYCDSARVQRTGISYHNRHLPTRARSRGRDDRSGFVPASRRETGIALPMFG